MLRVYPLFEDTRRGREAAAVEVIEAALWGTKFWQFGKLAPLSENAKILVLTYF